MRERIKQLKKISQKGFTLIELMAVLAILAILLAIAIPAIGKVIDKSDASSDKSSIELIERAGEKAHVEKTPFDEPSGDMPEESYTIPTLIDKGYLDLDEDSKFNSPDHYVVKENNQNDRNPNNDDDTTTPNKSGNFVYVGVGAPGNPGPGDTGGEPGPTVGPTPGFTPVTVAPDGCVEVRTAAELDAIRNNMAGCYVVMNPIDLSGYANWMPLGLPVETYLSAVSFTGKFDGQRYPITGLTVDRPTRKFTALFGRARTATFENVNLENVSISGDDNAAGLVGYADTNTIIDSSYVSGSVIGPTYSALLAGELDESTVTNSQTSGTVTGDYGTGGLVGEIYGTSVSNSYSTATVKGNLNVGGLIAGAYNWGTPGDITNSHATGSVEGLTAGMYIGGLVGYTQSGINLTNTYATGDVSNGQFAGGLIGALDGGNGDTVSKSYATGDVIGLSSGDAGGLIGNAGGANIVDSYSLGNVSTPVLADAVNDTPHTGGFIGYVEYDVTINNSFSAGTASGVGTLGGFIGLLEDSASPTNSYFNSDGNAADIYGATPKTLAQLKQQATFAGFDFTETWKSDGSNYPTLK